MNRNLHLFLILLIAGMSFSCSSDSPIEPNRNLEMSDRLEGVEIQFAYEGGNQYTAKFESAGMSYKFHKNGKQTNLWNGPYSYHHLITDMNQHLVSWQEPVKKDYVTLLINFENMSIYGSAILKGSHVHFQNGKIHSLNE